MPAPLPPLHLTTCGSVDDGKSTLLGRMLHDAGLIPDDVLAGLRVGGNAPDYALLLDGLEAEREQGITIDVAYRYANLHGRRLVIADAPGHTQYTRNMAVAASVSDLAIVLVDAEKGILTQTRRHTEIARLMGVQHVVLAVNKMDLIGFDQARFAAIVADYAAMATGFANVTAIPLAARDGDMVVHRGTRLPWYSGPTLAEYLQTIEAAPAADAPFRMPVQWVNRPDANFRGYAGTIASGTVAPGDAVAISGTPHQPRVLRIVSADGDLPLAGLGRAVTLVLDAEHDISRGTVLAAAKNPVAVSDQFSAHVVWLGDAPLVPGRAVIFKLHTQTVGGTITRIRHRLDVDSGVHEAADILHANDIGRVQLSFDAPAAHAPYAENRTLGGFLLIDRQSNATIGVGMIEHALTRAANLRWQTMTIDRDARAAQKAQRPVVLWFTGLSGAGKSTIADLVERRLHALGKHTYLLDGDNVRHGLNRDLGFTENDRVENIRRVGEVAALFADAGLIVLVSFISPYRADRAMAREKLPPGGFLEVFVDTPVAECRKRDPKGLYARADAGAIANFTGVSAPYEAPIAPDLHLHTLAHSAEDCAEHVVACLERGGFLNSL